MNDLKRQARLTGFLYLSLAITAPFSLLYVPNRLTVPGDAAATAVQALGSETLFRFGIAGRVLTATLFAIVVLSLFRLLERVNRTHATLMAVLALVSVPLSLFNAACDATALMLFKGAHFLTAFDKGQLDALGYLCLRVRTNATVVEEMFWGLWLLPFGLLVFRSRFLPRVLGVWLIINGLAYMAGSLTGMLMPHLTNTVSRILLPALMGELAIVLWLIIVGARPVPDWKEPATSGS